MLPEEGGNHRSPRLPRHMPGLKPGGEQAELTDRHPRSRAPYSRRGDRTDQGHRLMPRPPAPYKAHG